MTTTNTLDQLVSQTMQQIAAAAAKHDITTVRTLTNRATELEEMRKTMRHIEQRIQGLQTPAPAQTVTPADTPAVTPVVVPGQKLRELAVEVSQGMIRQNLLTLTEHVKRGRIQVGEDMRIQAQPSGDLFRTELLMNGNKLRERGSIGRFYREAGVQDGDFVVLTEIAPQRWTLQKAVPGQYRGRRDPLSFL